MESRFQRDSQNTTLQRDVNTHPRNFFRDVKIDFLRTITQELQIEARNRRLLSPENVAEEFRNETLAHRQSYPRLHDLRVFEVRRAVLTVAVDGK
jgi:hypothetical protein